MTSPLPLCLSLCHSLSACLHLCLSQREKGEGGREVGGGGKSEILFPSQCVSQVLSVYVLSSPFIFFHILMSTSVLERERERGGGVTSPFPSSYSNSAVSSKES